MSFSDNLRRAAGLIAGSLLYGFANGALFPLVPLAMAQHGESDAHIGTVATAYYIGGFLSTLTFGAVVSRVGFRLSLSIVALSGALAAALFLAPLSGWAWFALRLAFGYAAGAFYVVADAWLGALADREIRGRMLGLNEGVRTAAMIASPSLVLIGSLEAGFLIVAVAFGLLALPALLSSEPRLSEGPVRGTVDPAFFRRHGAMLVFNVMAGLVISVLYSMSALYAKVIGLPPASIALFLTVQAATGAVSLALLGALSDRFGRLRTIGIAMAAGAVAAALIAAAGETLVASAGLAGFLLPAIVVAAAGLPAYTITITRLIDLVPPREVVQATSAGLIAYTAGASFGPVVAGAAMGAFGPAGFYGFLAVVMTAFAFSGALTRMR